MSVPVTPDPTLPGSPQQPRHRKLRLALIAVAALVVLALGVGAFYAVQLNNSVTGNISRQDALPGDDASGTGQTARPSQDPRATGALNYVLLGSDSRKAGKSGAGRSDSIMVVHLNAKRTRAYIISFPRDMYVAIPGHGKNKINAAFSLGGAQLTVRTLEDLLGTRMDHVALVDFEGFIQLTDSLGGVTVRNKQAFSSHGFDYPKGDITIKGKQALWFVRERHHLAGGDLARAQNQRNVLKAIVDKGLSKGVLSDPLGYLDFVSGVAKHLTVDQTLSNSEIRSTALSLRMSSGDVKLLQAPISGFAMIGDMSVDVVNKPKLRTMAAALRKDKLGSYAKKNKEI